jgi:hypothetical protein
MVPPEVRLIATLTLSAIALAAVAWGALAVWFDGPQSRVLGGTMAAGLVLDRHAAAVKSCARGASDIWRPVASIARRNRPPSKERLQPLGSILATLIRPLLRGLGAALLPVCLLKTLKNGLSILRRCRISSVGRGSKFPSRDKRMLPLSA